MNVVKAGIYMDAEEEDAKKEVIDLFASCAVLDRLPNRDRVRISMEVAAHFLEYAAFEMALEQSAGDVSEIIHMAARLDQAARRIENDPTFAPKGRTIRKM